MISPSQRPLSDNSQQTNIHAQGWIRTHDRSRRAAVDLRLRPRGYWGRLIPLNRQVKTKIVLALEVSMACRRVISQLKAPGSLHITPLTVYGMWGNMHLISQNKTKCVRTLKSLHYMGHRCELGTMTEDGHHQLWVADLQSRDHTLVKTASVV
jgi:hypothetical protein